MADAALQRENMVESQVRPADVTDRRIIRAMAELPRERFVPASLKPMAYMDQEMALSVDAESRVERTMLRPMVLAKMVQMAEVERNHLVLDVGCLTGYSSALLAQLAESVVALEQEAELAARATTVLSDVAADNVAVLEGPLTDGYASQGPYDVIFMNGAVAEPPIALRAQLKPGGRLVCIVGEGVAGRAVAFERLGETWGREDGFSASAPVLPGYARPAEFAF